MQPAQIPDSRSADLEIGIGRPRRPPVPIWKSALRLRIAFALLAVRLVVPPVCTRAGELEQFFYLPLPGESVSDLTSAPEFPEQPFTVTPVNWFNQGLEGITNASTYYGSWLRGYLEAPVTGDFTFYVSADDSAELYLSTDHQAANKQLIARLQSPAPNGVYDQQFEQRSVPLRLERGRQYYFEIQHKQDGGTDHVQVGWLRPDNVLERPIPLRYVQRFVPASYDGPGVNAPASIAPVVEMPFTVGPIVKAWENQQVILAPNVSAVPPVYYQWFKNGAPLAGEHLSSLDLGEVTEADHGELFTLLVASAHGLELSADWPLQVRNDAVAPTIASAFVSGMADGFLLTFSEPLDPATATNPANYTLNLGINVTSVSLLHGTNLTTVAVRTTSFPPAGIPEVTVNHVRDRAQPPNTIAPNSTKLVSLADGRITLRYFGAVDGSEPLGGTALTDLPNPGQGNRFPNYPDLVTTRNEMGIPQNIADNYAAQLIGFLVPRVTGAYRFLISSDDQGVLYLSTNANPANKRAVAIDPQWGGWRRYTSTDRRTLNNTGNSGFIFSHFPNLDPNLPANDSLNTVGPIHLEAGRRYYIEALMKEGGGGDNLDVAWQLPGGPPVVNGQAPIPGEFLAQWPGASSGDAAITNQPANYSALEGRYATFSVGVTGTGPMTYQWFRNGVPIVDADGPVYTFPARLADQGALYSVRVRNDFSETWSVEAQLVVWADITHPRMVRAYADQHFDKVTLRFDEPVTAATATYLANYTITRTDTGQSLAVTTAEVRGFSDGGYTNVLLRTAPIASGVNYTVRTSGITDLSERANATRPQDAATFTGWVLSRGFAQYERWPRPSGGIAIGSSRDQTTKPPVHSAYVSSFESPENVGENYIGRVSGFFVAPSAGRYDFYMASDENGELWLANDSSSALPQTRIAIEPSWGNARSWTGSSDGRRNSGDNNTVGDSLPVLNMTAGEYRCLELIWQEGGGPDYGQATFSGPGEPVPVNGSSCRLRGNVIAAWGNPDSVYIAFQSEPGDQTVFEPSSATFSTSYQANSWNPGEYVPTFIQWQTNGVDVAGANGATFNTGPLAPVQNGLRVRCLVSAPGRTAISREAVVSVIPDIWPPSVRLTGNASLNEVWAIFSEPVDPATATAIQNYSINGLQIQTARMHHSDPRIVILNTAPQTPGTRFDWAVSGVRDPSTAQNELPPTTGTFAAWTLQLGWVRRELWTNIFSGKVADLTNHVKFPDHPDRVNYLPSVEAPANVADAYGQRLSGWLQVTNTGDFNFAIAADDQAVLYLSTDESPANKRAIVTEPEWGRERDWNSSDRRLASPGDDFFPAIDALPVNRSENTTGPIHLIVGERYYFEVLHKDGGGGDHAEVTMWPAGGLPPANGTPGIPGAQVWNFVNPDNQITITQQPEEMIVWPGAAAGFSTLAVALEGPVFYQWERNGVPISNALWRILDVPSGLAGAGGEVYRCRISAPGASASTVSVRLTVLESRHWNVQPSTDGRWRLLWRDDGNPQRLQTTTHLLPGAQWMDIPWLQDHGWYYELSIDPQAPGAGPQRFFRALPTE